jgi:hypothetical protein
MRFKFALLTLLLSPVCEAGVIATVGFAGETCNSSQTMEGESTADVSFTCPGATADAHANLFRLDVSGSKANDLPPVQAAASFDYSVLVTGTDQPGFLLIHTFYSHSMDAETPSRFQFTVARIDGIDLGHSSHPLYLYMPYTPGVAVALSGSLVGGAGASDIFRQDGDFFASIDPQIRITAQGVLDPFCFPCDLMFIPGASFEIVPEPTPVCLVIIGLMAMVLLRLRTA